ncbi:MAG: hypothetical protein KDE33_21465 [Bacteroidetes bacterium]|nr:hypothetical protein [Bacteroidota bacterium]
MVLQEMVLISEIVLQSKIAQRAAERLQSTHDNFDKVEVWCSIQSILVAAGNVSKILWPVKKEYNSRGEKLRQLLNIEADNPLSDRTFRNRFEHYDERIDDWFNNQPRAVYTDLSMNPSLRGSMATNDHRGYNSFNNTLVFRGKSLDLNEVLNALEEILNNCKAYVLT